MLASSLLVRYALNMLDDELSPEEISDLRDMLVWFQQIEGLLRPIQGNAIQINNAHFDTNTFATDTVVTVSGATAGGWQWPIRVADPHGGPVQSKCVGCDQFNHNYHLLCDDCRAVLRDIKGTSSLITDRVSALVAFAEDEQLVAFLSLLSVDSIRAYMEEAIGNVARYTQDDAGREAGSGEEPS